MAGRRRAAFLLLLASTSCGWGSAVEPGVLPERFDNVVLISIDSLRADHLGIYGYEAPTSPFLDHLGRTGLVFERAYSTTSWTLPSHTAMLTGLDDLTHGVTDHTRRVPSQLTTLPERLSASGIETVGFFSGPYLHPSFGIAQGFDRYVNCSSSLPRDRDGVSVKQHFESMRDVTNPIVLESVAAWLREPRAQRTFLFIHLWDVHYDYIPPDATLELFDADYTGSISAEKFESNDAIHAGMDARDLEHIIARYDAEIRATDDTIRQLMAALEDAGLLQNAAILVVSDHGEEFFEHGGKGHHTTLYEEVLHVPLILNVPGRRPVEGRVGQVVSLVDLYPTVCALFGIPCPGEGPGESLLPLFRGSTGRRGDALAHLSIPGLGISENALVSLEGKVIRVTSPISQTEFFGPETLHSERDGVAAAATGDASSRRIIGRLEHRVSAAMAARGRLMDAEAQETGAPDRAVEQQLRSLGYLK